MYRYLPHIHLSVTEETYDPRREWDNFQSAWQCFDHKFRSLPCTELG
jgi:hypothetical protein